MGEDEKPATLAPPAVVALKEEAAAAGPHRVAMERTVSQDIREEREDLKEAAEHSLNVIMDLDLDGKIRYVSESWKDVVGTTPEEVVRKPLADILLSNPAQFADCVAAIKTDDSRSRIIRFSVRMGPHSILRRKRSKRSETEESLESPLSPVSVESEEEQVLNLEAQGILVYDRNSGVESHVSRLFRHLFTVLTVVDYVDDTAVCYPRSHH